VTETILFEPGGYRYVPGPFQYSAGVAAEPGFAIERVRFKGHAALEDGFRAVEAYLGALGRPPTSFCACELRSPAPFTEAGFVAFNRIYVGTLERWGIFRDDDNPVARSNVCPAHDGPAEPGFHAFSYTMPQSSDERRPTFVVSGAAEATEGPGSYRERIIRPGDTSPGAMREKAQHVLASLEARMSVLGLSWGEATATQVYTVHDLFPVLEADLVARGAVANGLTWHYARPPVEGLDYEMDVRGVRAERVI
jgi:hypothetical protein